jgi:hydroxymethylglutaryl-CoA reductase
MLAAADWADETRGPAPTHHRLAALILGSVQTGKLNLTEALLKLDLVTRHRSNSQKQPFVPGSYHHFLAEDSR